MSKPIRAYIVDDSAIIRYALAQLLGEEEDIIVVGDSPFDKDLVEKIKQASPAVVILDIPLPREKGVEELKKLHPLHLPIIAFTKGDDSIARDLIPLLSAGAVGFVLKPDKDDDLSGVRDQLLYELRINTKTPLPVHPNKPKEAKVRPGVRVSYNDPQWIVVIGSSTGGPEALASIIHQFPANFPAGIVIVQHMPAGFTTRFSTRLNGLANLTVKEAQEGDIVKAGLILVAPGDYHLLLGETLQGSRRVAKVKLTKDPPMWKLRPTVDKMMCSIAPLYGEHCIGVILTGMGEDGVIGMNAIKKEGGHTLVQNKETSVVFGMAQEVVKKNLADEVLPLLGIVPRIRSIIER